MACCCCGTEYILGIITIGLCAYYYIKSRFSHWKRSGVPYSTPSFPLGNAQGISRTKNFGDVLSGLYHEGKGCPVYGIYILLKPSLLIRDPELIKLIMVKDFGSFNGRGIAIDIERDPLSNHLFFLEGVAWRNLRKKLTPAFTSGKLRMMFPIVSDACTELGDYLTSKSGSVIDADDLFTKYASNVITRSAFGINCDFFKDGNPMLWKMIHRVANPNLLDSIKRGFTFSIGQAIPFFRFPLIPEDLSKYFVDLIENVIEEREKQKTEKNDFLQLLIELKNKGYIEDTEDNDVDNGPTSDSIFTIKDAAAQAFVFLLGGFDTSAFTLQCCLFELAHNQDVQDKVREEARQVLGKSGLTHDSLKEMTYIEQVFKETMRLHPAVRFFNRVCKKPFQMPNMDLVLEPGASLWISTAGILTDPLYFPQPEKFDPERFSKENIDNILPYTYLPFGDGPRICIGNRFAKMQITAVIAYLISYFRVDVAEETPASPLKLDPKKGISHLLNGMPLRFTKL